MHHLLIIEDDIALSNGIVLALKDDDVKFVQAHTIDAAKKQIASVNFDLVILDINLPDGSGLELLAELRRTTAVPVIVLTANDLETDIVTGFELGADDYITKPFSLMVLRARVGVQLKKVRHHLAETVQMENFSFSFDKMVFSKKGSAVELSKTEQKLLRILIENRGQTVSRSDLVDRIWTDGGEYVDENALSVTIKRLRDKLEDTPSSPVYIKNVYGIGYTWAVK
ncbi:OmpR family two-component response regulator [Paenibacillus riograndensis]|uniref:OmpR family two-component response regulator n=1 Tax=Paenibacillus riograndensis TaxID=483937 RepID=A0A132TTF8_9BACL|nr:response regulator transcription factor [Paenibacillus riograndensis]KWX74366.1 OmpR family two-component response regulator [Paenibacillus riograndensis]KWX85035.1 OmpR family two-component response regulator [Paenibacillus riograndensis]